MTRKKIAAILCVGVMAMSMVTTTASAHGHHGRTNRHSVCTVEDCSKTGTHKHNGTYYCGYSQTRSNRHGCR